ncbi:M56 family metallopeptidase [Solwaraspora sp. WMMD1047]|uniref:M56 family metallopeptidase n=1 Tax=Solwaraspora sp. WMMD1047 TaxID=3016102 RepID=UPI00241654FB|nr:M56 family metallopeptidase [Solwaraspora sp. WMMD1047]MDG4834217.1 M56 family metallopeptidase [Solwaraspora sp. WMMD1047]
MVERTWIYRVPCAAVGLWLGAVLGVPFGAVAALLILISDQHTWQMDNTAPSLLAALVSAVLLLGAGRVGRRFAALNRAARQRRRRHEMLIDLFATERPDLGKVNVIDDRRPFAYSVPCIVSGRTVLSQGALDLLEPKPLQAVLRHERAHLLARHHLVLQLATAVAQSFPGTRAITALSMSITELIEMSADCYARRHVGQKPTIAALTLLADMAVPAGALPAGGRAVALRLAQLHIPRHCCQTARSKGTYALGAALLVLSPTVLLLNAIVIDLCPWGAA